MDHPHASEAASVATMVGSSPTNILGINMPGSNPTGVPNSQTLGSILATLQNAQAAANPLGVTGSTNSPPSFSLGSDPFATMLALSPPIQHHTQHNQQHNQPHHEQSETATSPINNIASIPSLVSSTQSPPRQSYCTRRMTRSSARAGARVYSESSRTTSARLDQLGNSRPVQSQAPKEPVRPRRTSSRKRKNTTKDDGHLPAPPKKRRASLKKPPPAAAGLKDDSKEDMEKVSCCICMCEPEPADVASINGCEHMFCFECIEKWSDRENTCPLCKVRFSKIDRVLKRKSGERKKNSKRVKQRDQRSDIAPGAALEGLLASLTSNPPFPPHRVARLIFSGMGNPFLINTGRQPAFSGRRTRSSESPAAGFSQDELLSSDTDDESGLLGGAPSTVTSFHDLIRAIPRSTGLVMSNVQGAAGGGSVRVLRPMSFTQYNPSHAASARSYASNINDQSAGLGAENPLEIDDSDDEGEVEVIQVTRPC